MERPISNSEDLDRGRKKGGKIREERYDFVAQLVRGKAFFSTSILPLYVTRWFLVRSFPCLYLYLKGRGIYIGGKDGATKDRA